MRAAVADHRAVSGDQDVAWSFSTLNTAAKAAVFIWRKLAVGVHGS